MFKLKKLPVAKGIELNMKWVKITIILALKYFLHIED